METNSLKIIEAAFIIRRKILEEGVKAIEPSVLAELFIDLLSVVIHQSDLLEELLNKNELEDGEEYTDGGKTIN